MKRSLPWFLFSLIAWLCLSAFVSPLPHMQTTPPTTTIEFLLNLLFGLSIAAPGGAALIVILINIGKLFGWVPNTKAEIATNILTVVFALGYGVVALFFPIVSLPGVDSSLNSIAATLTALLPLLAILVKWLAPKFYGAVRGFPLLGYHH